MNFVRLGNGGEIKNGKYPTKTEVLPDAQNGEGAVAQVACGAWHTLVVTVKGRLFSFGSGHFGQLAIEDIEKDRYWVILERFVVWGEKKYRPEDDKGSLVESFYSFDISK